MSGSGTSVSVAGHLLIGADFDSFNDPITTGGSGVLSVENGSTVTVSEDLILRGSNRLTINGGNLSISGDLNLSDSNAELNFILGSAGATGLSAGNVLLNNTLLDIELTYQPGLGDIITLIEVDDFGAVVGNFMYGSVELLHGSIFEVNSNSFQQEFQISYGNSNDVTLTAVPEPTTWTLILGAATLGFIFLRRRREKIANR